MPARATAKRPITSVDLTIDETETTIDETETAADAAAARRASFDAERNTLTALSTAFSLARPALDCTVWAMLPTEWAESMQLLQQGSTTLENELPNMEQSAWELTLRGYSPGASNVNPEVRPRCELETTDDH